MERRAFDRSTGKSEKRKYFTVLKSLHKILKHHEENRKVNNGLGRKMQIMVDKCIIVLLLKTILKNQEKGKD